MRGRCHSSACSCGRSVALIRGEWELRTRRNMRVRRNARPGVASSDTAVCCTARLSRRACWSADGVQGSEKSCRSELVICIKCIGELGWKCRKYHMHTKLTGVSPAGDSEANTRMIAGVGFFSTTGAATSGDAARQHMPASSSRSAVARMFTTSPEPRLRRRPVQTTQRTTMHVAGRDNAGHQSAKTQVEEVVTRRRRSERVVPSCARKNCKHF